MSMEKDSLLPEVYKVASIVHDTADVFTLILKGNPKSFLPGQFNMIYSFGYGESALSICTEPEKKDELVHTVRAVGSVTNSLQKLQPGDEVGVRGPFGTHWPCPKNRSEILVIAGGIGLAALRSAIYSLAKDHQVTLIFGTRTPQDILYQSDMEKWKEIGVKIEVTVDLADLSWKGNVGVVTKLIGKHLVDPDHSLVLICGPEVMMQFAVHELMQLKVSENNIYLSMERNMQCAVGFCGHCQYGPYFLCKDGPVFSYSQLKFWLPIKEL